MRKFGPSFGGNLNDAVMNRSLLLLLSLLIPAVHAATLNVGSGQTYATIGCGSHAGQIFENLIEQAVEGCPNGE